MSSLPKNFKVALVGNIANNFYREGKALQQIEDIEFHLFMQLHAGIPNTELPESDEPSLFENYPSWIKCFSLLNFKSLYYKYLGLDFLVDLETKSLLEELSRYDLCIFSGPEIALIPFVKTQTIFRATGSDLTVFPLFSFREFNALRSIDLRNVSPKSRLRGLIQHNLNRLLYKKAVKKVDFVDWGFGKPFQDALQKLHVPSHKLLGIFRLTIDQEVFKPVEDSADYCKLKWGFSEDDFLVFIPSRIMISDSSAHRKTGQWKASDEAILGFRLFLDGLTSEKAKKTFLVIPDRTRSDELEKAKALTESLNMSDNVRFIRGTSAEGLTRYELIRMYSRAAVVMDDFGAGWYGSVVVEALSCSCPVISYVPQDIMSLFSDWHPILIAKKKRQIADMIRKIHDYPEFAAQLKEKSRQWIAATHSSQSVRSHVENELRKVLEKSPKSIAKVLD
ncbi:MAG TPA: glycosyltransferase [Algoriphagus sp.]|nr:glycosyltransferase [Algoriphagus sp.]